MKSESDTGISKTQSHEAERAELAKWCLLL
jgi:hypothetical protein